MANRHARVASTGLAVWVSRRCGKVAWQIRHCRAWMQRRRAQRARAQKWALARQMSKAQTMSQVPMPMRPMLRRSMKKRPAIPRPMARKMALRKPWKATLRMMMAVRTQAPVKVAVLALTPNRRVVAANPRVVAVGQRMASVGTLAQPVGMLAQPRLGMTRWRLLGMMSHGLGMTRRRLAMMARPLGVMPRRRQWQAQPLVVRAAQAVALALVPVLLRPWRTPVAMPALRLWRAQPVRSQLRMMVWPRQPLPPPVAEWRWSSLATLQRMCRARGFSLALALAVLAKPRVVRLPMWWELARPRDRKRGASWSRRNKPPRTRLPLQRRRAAKNGMAARVWRRAFQRVAKSMCRVRYCNSG